MSSKSKAASLKKNKKTYPNSKSSKSRTAGSGRSAHRLSSDVRASASGSSAEDEAQASIEQVAAAIEDVPNEGKVEPSDIEEAASSIEDAMEQIREEDSRFSDLPGVLIAAAECAPLAKTGGLADVVGALPKYLRKLGIDARVIMPFHRQIKERYGSEAQHMFDYNAGEQWSSRFVGVDKLELDGVIYYFVDNNHYYHDRIYSGDNFEGEQYAFFAQAVCDIIPNLDFNVGIVHCNDWHTAMVPFKLKARAAREWTLPPKTLLTIHNLAFQGTFGKDTNDLLVGPDERAYAWDLGCWNMMKAGIDTSDRVNTVSPTYAYEITTPELGEGLQDDLRYLMETGRLTGILNGIDLEEWDPKTDSFLKNHFNVKRLDGKARCKERLLEELGLEADLDAPLVGMVGRLTLQKGIDLAAELIEVLVQEGAMFAILGTGDRWLEDKLRDLENRHKGRVCSYIGYDNALSHRIYAGTDFFLMPSVFEPCGISQMIAMRYGSLPIVHETGGLKDTVKPYNKYTGEGCGFSFSRFDFWDAVEVCKFALSVFSDKAIMRRLIRNAMGEDFGFDRCAKGYAELYLSMT